MQKPVESFHYRLAQPGHSVFPGAHPGRMLGSGQLFMRHEPLLASPDPRRIDLRASLLDPFQQYRVRVFQQPSQLSVYVVLDLSASMRGKLPAVTDFVLSAAQSAMQLGDKFGFIGCGQHLEPQWVLPAGSSLAAVIDLVQRINQPPRQWPHWQRHKSADIATADSLSQIAHLLPDRRSLLFLVSDCHYALHRLQQILQPLTGHAVLPLVWWEPGEVTDLPEWGLVRFQDAENQRSKTLWLRPQLKQQIIQAYQQRRQQLQQVFRSVGLEPLFVSDAYRAEDLNAYFQRQAL